MRPRDLATRPAHGPIGSDALHESAAAHVSGRALYTDDLTQRYPGLLHAWPVASPHAHATLTSLSPQLALEVHGVVRILTRDDVPGVNDGGVRGDEPLFPTTVHYLGQPVAWVLGESLEAARRGAAKVAEAAEWDIHEPLVDLEEAIAAGSFQGATSVVRSGDHDVSDVLANSAYTMRGVSRVSGQEHFYLETHSSIAQIDEAGQVHVQCSTQHPSETQEIVAHVLGLPSNAVTVQCLRMGGGFGGKEMQPHGLAAVAALGATLTGRPVRLRLNRNQDMTMTGKRHPFHAEWEVGFDDEARFTGLRVTLTSDGGWSLDLSEAVLARALCHIDNAYDLGAVHAVGRVARTHKTSQTAFRGFGGPQGMFVVEDIIGRCAPLLGLPAHEVRRRNLYAPGAITPYGQPVRHAERLSALWDKLTADARLDERRAEIAAFNASHDHVRRGLAITPVKFGISFNFTAFNQAGALVHIYKDGSVLLNHGGTEMGQGLHTKMILVAATALGVEPERVRIAPTRTDKVPNTSATAASSGADLNGGAVRAACDQLCERLRTVAAGLFDDTTGETGDDENSVAAESVAHPHGPTAAEDVAFGDGLAHHPDGRTLAWDDVVKAAYFARVSLSQSGFYATPGLTWDKESMHGHPFKYFAYGVAASEVEVDAFTGASVTRAVDIIHDVGDSLAPVIDRGQIEGGFIQGLGWLTLEDLRWDSDSGRLTTQAASTYKLPSFSEVPERFSVQLMENATEDGVVYGSKAVGEPPLMLAFSVREAIRDAVASFADDGTSVELASPATPEAIWWAMSKVRR